MKKQNKLYLVLIILLVSITNIMAGIGDYEKHKIFASDGANYNYFGNRGSVAIDGDYAIVGALYADVNGINNCGAAYIYFWNGTAWVEQAKLSASNAAEEQHFGQSVSIYGDRVVIGAMGDYSTNSLGQAYVFKRNGTSWNEEAILTASDGANRDAFGTDVSIIGDELFVSANDINSYKGAVYYFKFNGTNWVEEQIITPTSSSGWKQFGKSLVFDESNLLVGCIDDGYSGFRMPGAVYAFAKENGIWVQKSRILPDDNTVRASFGISVALKNGIAVISDVDTTPEKVYVFNKTNDTTWTQIDTLKSGAITNDLFGYDVAIDDEHILVGSKQNSNVAYETGSVFVYKSNGSNWILDENIYPPNNETMAEFGAGVACKDGRYIFGASQINGNTYSSGAAFIYMAPELTPGVITSTSAGGNWDASTTWIGGVVPTETDNVVIDGEVLVNNLNAICANLTINSSKTLTKDNNGRTLYVLGDLTNYGIITENNYDEFSINITGNLINNGVWERGNIIFSGTNDNKIIMSSAKTINNSKISKVDPNSYLIISSDARFNNCIFSNDYYGSASPFYYQIKTEEGSSFTFDLMKTSILRSLSFNGSGSILKDAILQSDGSGKVWLENVNLKGTVVVSSDSVFFAGNKVIIEDTLTKDNNGRPLYVIGDLTNNGVITENNYDEFSISITGNLINNGVWENCWAVMNGTVDQNINISDAFTGKVRLKVNVASSSSYQWYKDASIISGATAENYDISPFTADNYGDYYCQTNAGNSRTISIIGGSSEGGVILSENFNGTQFPPNGWTQTILNSTKTWVNSNPEDNPFTIDPENVYSAICPWVAANQDEWLKTPIVSLPDDAISLEFYAGYSTSWLTSATLKLNISTDGGSNWTKIWEAENDGNGWTWRKTSINLTGYGNNSNVILAWQYVGNDGDLVGIDNVMLTYGTVDVEQTNSEIPIEFALNQNYPNPFNPSTIISYQLPKQGFVTLNIYNILGQKVASLVNEEQNAGNYQFNFDASKLSTGTYIYQIQSGNFVQARKMLLIK